jgi:hypothetical protein
VNSIQEANDAVEAELPFDGFMRPWQRAYPDVTRTALKYLRHGGRILNFASGPFDQTAVLQKLGYDCKAFDGTQKDRCSSRS